MKKILVVFTGGTIGSIATAGTINTSSAAPFKLIHQFQQHYRNHHQIHFSTIQPMQILSENLAPPVWQALITAIEAQRPEQFDGIIITHGTDTLAYTAAALSFYFNAIKIPMLLVSSNYPLDDFRANGLDNFICAVEFIMQNVQAGVFVPYRNPQRSTHVHFGSRLTCSLQLSGDFFSVQDKSFMQFENERFSLLNSTIKLTPNPSLMSGHSFNQVTTGIHEHDTELEINTGEVLTAQTISSPLKANFCERILMIKPYPGLNYAHFNLENVDAVLHDLYHSGTACASAQWGGDYSLSTFINLCSERNIKVYLAPAIKSAEAYQSTRALLDQDAEMIWNMSIEAVYVKLMLAHGNFAGDKQKINEFMNLDIAGEHV